MRRRLRCLVRIGSSTDPLLASTRDVGSGGIYVETLWRPPLKSKIDLEVVLEPGRPAIHVRGVVVRLGSHSEEPGFAIRFAPCEGATAIAEWVVRDIEAQLSSHAGAVDHSIDAVTDRPEELPDGPPPEPPTPQAPPEPPTPQAPPEPPTPQAPPSQAAAAAEPPAVAARRGAPPWRPVLLASGVALAVVAVVSYGVLDARHATPEVVAPAPAEPPAVAEPSAPAEPTSPTIDAEVDWEPALVTLVSRRHARRGTPAARGSPSEPPAPAAEMTAAAPAAPEAELVALAPIAETPAETAQRLGVRFLGERKPLLALEAFEEVLRLEPDHPLALRGMGVANVMLGRSDDAAQAFERFVTLAPDHPSAARVRQALEDYHAGR